MNSVIVKPLVSEKNTKLNDKAGKFVFEVTINATKPAIKEALIALYPEIVIDSVNTLIMPSKPKGRQTRGGYQAGRTKKRKKAIITLKSGTIDLFGEI